MTLIPFFQFCVHPAYFGFFSLILNLFYNYLKPKDLCQLCSLLCRLLVFFHFTILSMFSSVIHAFPSFYLHFFCQTFSCCFVTCILSCQPCSFYISYIFHKVHIFSVLDQILFSFSFQDVLCPFYKYFFSLLRIS